MNILVINHYAGGGELGMEFRPWYLGKEWVRQGHTVYVVGANCSHLRIVNPTVSHDLEGEVRDGIHYLWLRTPAYGGTAKRVLNMGVFVAKLWCYARRIVKMCSPDLVVASSTYPLDNRPACRMARMAGAKYVYEVHDLWPLSPMLIGGYSPQHPFIRVMQRAEDYAYRHVDKVVSLLWNSEAHMREHGLSEGKFVCVPNGYDPADWTDDRLSLPLPEAHRHLFDSLAQGKIIVGFAGGFAASGALLTLLEAAQRLQGDERLHFVLVGKGPEQDSYERYIAEQGLHNVSLLPPVAKQLVPAVCARFDIAYLGGVHSELHRYGTSYNKMTDYMLAGKPIVQAVDEPGSAVETTQCGIRVEAENAREVAAAIAQLAAMSDEERVDMGARGRVHVEQTLSWGTLAEQFIASV